MAITVLLFLVIAEVSTRHYIKIDRDVVGVNEFIKNNPHVISEYGNIHEVSVAKITKVSGADGVHGYKLYAMYVSGNKKNGVVEVKVILDDGRRMLLGR